MKQDLKNIIIALILSIVITSQYNLTNAYALFENPNESNDSINVTTDDESSIPNKDNYTEENTVSPESTEYTEIDSKDAFDNPTPIEIHDANLLNAINNTLGIDGSTEVLNSSNILNLKELDASGLGITDLSGIESASNLSILNLSNNNIKDVTPLSNLENLNCLFLNNNNIVDLSPVATIAQKIIDAYGTDDSEYGFQALNQTYNIDAIKVDKGSDVTLTLGSDILQPINMYKETTDIESINPSGNIDGLKISIINILESSEYKINFYGIEGWSFTYNLRIEVNNPNAQNPNDSNEPISPDNPTDPNNNNSNNNNNNTIVDIDDNSNNNIVNNDITVVTKIKNVINKNTFISKLSNIKIDAKDQSIHVGDLFEPMKNVTATDSDGSDITKKVIISDSTVVTNEKSIAIQAGKYKVTYKVTGKSGKTIYKTVNVSVHNYSEEKVENIKTGDNSIIIFAALGIIAVLSLIIINVVFRKKK